MEFLSDFVSERMAAAITWTVLHSLWQASLIALIMSIYLNRYREEKSIVRYRISLASLLMVLMASSATFGYYYLSYSPAGNDPWTIGSSSASILILSNGLEPSGGSILSSINGFLHKYMELIALSWLIGASLFSMRICGGYIYAQSLKQPGNSIIPEEIKTIFQRLKAKLKLSGKIQLLESARIDTPMVVGYLKPAILFPLGVINQLEMKEVEAILAHELAHVARKDFLVNLVQSVVETIFYYHPAVWWISANIRSERENCCDDAAIHLCGNPLHYAKALVKIQEMPVSNIPSLAIPLARNRQNLFNRICRILDQPQNRSQIREKMVATFLLFSVVFCFASGSEKFKDFTNQEEPVTKIEIKRPVIIKENPVIAPKIYIRQDTIPKKKKEKITIESQTDSEKVEIQIEDGEVKELKVNGEKIEEKNYNDYSELYEKFLDGHGRYHFDFDFGDFGGVYKLDSLMDSGVFKRWPGLADSVMGTREWKWIGELPENWEEYTREWSENWKLDTSTWKDRIYNFSEIWDNEHFFKDSMIHKQYFDAFENLENFQWGNFSDSAKFFFPGEGNFIFSDSLFGNLDLHWDNENWQESFGNLFQDLEGLPEYDFSFDHNFNFSQKLGDVLLNQMWEEGLLEEGKDNIIELTGEHLIINGIKQPESTWKKYKELYEDRAGHELTTGSKLEYKVSERKKLNTRKRI